MTVLPILLVLVLLALNEAVNPLKDYCKNYAGDSQNGDKYIPSVKYPHLHCNKDFLVYSRRDGGHDKLINGDKYYCQNIEDVLKQISAEPDSQGKKDMLAIVTKVQADGCSEKVKSEEKKEEM